VVWPLVLVCLTARRCAGDICARWVLTTFCCGRVEMWELCERIEMALTTKVPMGVGRRAL
jgi:hypothetical protein